MSDELSHDISTLCANVFANNSVYVEISSIVTNHRTELEQAEVWDEIKFQMENELLNRKISHRYTSNDAEAIEKCYQNLKILHSSRMLISINSYSLI